MRRCGCQFARGLREEFSERKDNQKVSQTTATDRHVGLRHGMPIHRLKGEGVAALAIASSAWKAPLSEKTPDPFSSSGLLFAIILFKLSIIRQQSFPSEVTLIPKRMTNLCYCIFESCSGAQEVEERATHSVAWTSAPVR
jgi:hypothetical protein